MAELKLVGEFNCVNCGKPIKIEKIVDLCNKSTWNIEHKKCHYCGYLNTLTADIRVTAVSEEELNIFHVYRIESL